MKLKRKSVFIGLGVTVLVLVVGGGLAWSNGQSKPALESLATATVQRGSIAVTVSDSGSVAGNLQVDVSAEVAGTVSTVRADVGALVKKGDVLAVIDSPDVFDAVRQTELDLRSAEAKLQEMIQPSSRASQNDIDQARARLALAEATKATRQSDLDSLTVKTPVGGTVSSLRFKEGDQAGSGSVLATIMDMDHLTFVLPVTEDGVVTVREGYEARVVIGSGNEWRSGTVTAVDQAGYVSGGKVLYDVTISLEGGFSPDVRPAMSGYAIVSSIEGGWRAGLEGKGTVQPALTYDLHLQAGGTVSRLYIREGSRVATGETVAELSNDQTTVAARQAELDYESALRNLNELLSPSSTAAAADITAQQVRVEQLRLTLASRQRDVAALTVRSPIDGIVIARNVVGGDKVTTGGQSAGLFTVADYSRMQVSISVDELDIAKVQMGQKAAVTLDALPGKQYTAEVVTVAAAGQQQQGVATFPVTLSLENPGEIKSGMTANVVIMIEKKDGALTVPLEAVQRRGGGAVVRLLVDGEVVPTPVQTGLSNDTVIEVVSGLKEGDLVVTGAVTASQQADLNSLRFLQGGGARPDGGRVPMGTQPGSGGFSGGQR